MWLQQLLCVAIIASLRENAFAMVESPIVTTEGGMIRGITEQAINGNSFCSFYGIPYAEPPVGELRFKDPVKARSWSGVRDGSKKASPCVNIPFLDLFLGKRFAAHQLPGNEDCLYLNVFKPKAAAGIRMSQGSQGLPVMVYIHGGAFFSGDAEELPPYILLSRDIVLVVLQYRLGFLGFLSTEDSVLPGNYGLKDQTLALHWVQRNIHNFGGDPKRVTIFGHSAGAASAHFQLLSPKARGLFSGAILQSGSALVPWALNPQHKRIAADVGSLVGCNLEQGSQMFLNCMQSIDPRKITLTSQQLFIWFLIPFFAAPRIDGDFIPDHPLRLLKEGRYNKVNVISGITANEGALFTLPMYNTQSHLLEELKNKFTFIGPLTLGLNPFDGNTPAIAYKILEFYLGGLNLDPPYADNVTQMFGDTLFNIGHDMTTFLHAVDDGTQTFQYEFTHRGPWLLGTPEFGTHWVIHGDDIPYLRIPRPPPQSPMDLSAAEDFKVMNLMTQMWTNFATYGHPTPDDSLGFRWNPATRNQFHHLDFSSNPCMRGDQRQETRRFLLSLPTKINTLLHSPVTASMLNIHNSRTSPVTGTRGHSSNTSRTTTTRIHRLSPVHVVTSGTPGSELIPATPTRSYRLVI
ncbi:juvenile hormone esterase-like [Palaemon carinicauda]|uniref:juvenile hormone esterase-like n=1 Tax=Palaemon carinicauda TaxID=392227 RepID=UPI0035B6889E